MRIRTVTTTHSVLGWDRFVISGIKRNLNVTCKGICAFIAPRDIEIVRIACRTRKGRRGSRHLSVCYYRDRN